MVSFLTRAFVCILLASPCVFSQDPLPVLDFGWRFTTQKAPRADQPTTGPAKALTEDDLVFQRNARNARTDHPQDPSELTPDGRRAAIEKIEQEARTPKADDIRGFYYSARVRNDSGQTINVIFWEYSFTEIARPTNTVRRQFLCGVNLKKGNEMELSAFSSLAPSDVIDANSLSKPKEKLFDEKVQVNRIELSDGSILQRGNWKLKDVQAGVDRATSTPWGKEICRAL